MDLYLIVAPFVAVSVKEQCLVAADLGHLSDGKWGGAGVGAGQCGLSYAVRVFGCAGQVQVRGGLR